MMLRKLLAFAVILCLSLALVPISASAGGDGNYDMWGFDGSDDSTWTFIDGDGDGKTFAIEQYFTNYFAIRSYSYDEDNGVGITPDNYAVSPLVQLTDAEEELYLHWTAFGFSDNWSDEHYSVYVYTGTEELDATNIANVLGEAAFVETLPCYSELLYSRCIDISEYMGQSVRFVFRHHDTTDVYCLGIDDISINNTALVSHIHQWDTEYSYSDTHHWYNCTVNYCPGFTNGNLGYEGHNWGYEYELSNHHKKCKECGCIDYSTYEGHVFTVTTDETQTHYDCDICDAFYSYTTADLIELPIIIEGEFIAGSKEVTGIPGDLSTDKYEPIDGISNLWSDTNYYPVTEFVDGETYIYQLRFMPKGGNFFPLQVDKNSLQVTGIDWDSVDVWISFEGYLCFEGYITYDAENGIPAPAPEAIKGDVNGDGVVDNLDAAMVLKYDAGLIDLIENGDVNDDGTVDNLDAAMILKYDAGLIESL